MPGNYFVVEEFMSKSLKQNQVKAELALPPPPKAQLQQVDPKTTLFELMKKPIIVAQCCGLFPVFGVGKSTDELEFRWLSLRTLYASFCISGNIVMAFFFFWWISHRGLKLENMGKVKKISLRLAVSLKRRFSGSLCFYSTSLFCTILFFKLAHVWPKLAKEWDGVEKSLASYPPVTNVSRKFKLICWPVLFLALSKYEVCRAMSLLTVIFIVVEHILAIAISFGWLSKCADENLAILHIRADFPQWFCYIDYSHFKAFLSEVNTCIRYVLFFLTIIITLF